MCLSISHLFRFAHSLLDTKGVQEPSFGDAVESLG